MSIEELYATRVGTKSDISEHMDTLRSMAAECLDVVEFGIRSGNSTVAFLAGLGDAASVKRQAYTLTSYDITKPEGAFPEPMCVAHIIREADTSKLQEIPECDLLFIDTLHTYEQVKAELEHACRVRRWIVFHDTVLFAWNDEHTGKLPGIDQAIFEFLAAEWQDWHVHSHRPNNCGLLILERN